MGESYRKLTLFSHLSLALLVLVIMGAWDLLVPWCFEVEPALGGRLRSYSLFGLVVALCIVVVNHRWLRQLYRKWPSLLKGELSTGQARQLIGRVLGYPLRIYLLFALGGVGLALSVAVIQALRLHTPARTVVLLFLAALSLVILAAMLAYGLAHLWMDRFTKIPAQVVPASWNQTARKAQLVVGLASAVSVSWLLCGTQMLHRLSQQVLPSHPGPFAHPQVAAAVAFIDLGGVVMVAAAILVSWALADDVRRRLDLLAKSLISLAEAEEPGSRGGLALDRADEVSDLVAAFNRLSQKMSRRAIELRQAALDAREAHQRQMELIDVVCHNLRTPLHSITGFSQLLLEQKFGLRPEQLHDVSAILRASHHLLGLVDDVVDISKMESDLLALNCCRVDLKGVVQEALDAGSILAAGKLALQARLEETLPLVWADELRLRQILLNLISNAVKYAGHGTVLVRAEKVQCDFVRLSVEDEGPGLPQEYLGRIFQEFELARSSDRTRGTGLGLAITKKLVELHGGQIWAMNRPQGGAGFYFTVPAWQETGAPR